MISSKLQLTHLKKPTDIEIETYVRFPEQLNKKQVEWIESEMKKDDDLRLLAEWLVSYYRILDEMRPYFPHNDL